MTADTEGSLRWTVHPAADSPARAAVVVLLVAVSGLFATTVAGSTSAGVFCTLALLLSLRAFFLPRTYALDLQGARETGALAATRAMAWDEVRRVSRARFGVHLSPLRTTSRWIPDRGLFLRTAGNAEEVLAFVEARRASP